jgi:ADP-ribosylation factor GTPase-activating protein 2/3
MSFVPLTRLNYDYSITLFVVLQSEKKYSSKAAPEYRKYLAKLMSEEAGSGAGSLDLPEEKTAPGGDATSRGIDEIISSLSNSNLVAVGEAAGGGSGSNSGAGSKRTSPVPPPSTSTSTSAIAALNAGDSDNEADTTATASAAAASPKPVPVESVFRPPPAVVQPKGTLSIEGTSAASTTTSATAAVDPLKLLGKKPVASKKSGIGARKIVTSTPADVRIESFESVEKRAAVAQQEQEDRALAIKTQQQLNEAAKANMSSGRVAAMMLEADGIGGGGGGANGGVSKPSIYRNTSGSSTPGGSGGALSGSSIYRSAPAPAAASRGSSGGMYGNLGAGSNGSSSRGGGAESTAARDKYSNQKGISSDQFFGRDQADAEAMRGRLQGQYSNSTAISSDMMYGTGDRTSDDHDDDGSATLERLKDSVAGFFDSFGK